ncbi:hypothetical protein ANN_26191 [Periplaneta americana]|uniref:Reverse transcriptase domain-containing protein n=1 Tax=Periplaneta americana TaxID=6978 RepID=A0ABQ8S5L8_PERAM|nr:hypothetical protein ANN_26191 [Periplaneta americana]
MLGENPQTIRKNTGILLEASKEIGLEVNPEKTKYRIMSRDENIVRNGNIKIGDLSFEEVEKFKYLGATIARKLGKEEEEEEEEEKEKDDDDDDDDDDSSYERATNSDNAGEMNPGSSTESYPSFAHTGLEKNPGINLNQWLGTAEDDFDPFPLEEHIRGRVVKEIFQSCGDAWTSSQSTPVE